MAEAKERVNTPVGVLSFPHFEEKHKASPNANARFEGMIVFDVGIESDPDYLNMQRIAKEAMLAQWGEKPKDFQSPFKDSADKQEKYGEPFGAGRICITAKTDDTPVLLDRNRNVIEDRSTVYPGCFGRFRIHAYAWEVSGNRGVSFGLDGFQFSHDGEPLGGRERVADGFEDLPTPEGEGVAGSSESMEGLL